MRRLRVLPLLIASLGAPVLARHNTSVCGTTRETANETLFLHRQSLRARAQTPAVGRRAVRQSATSATSPSSKTPTAWWRGRTNSTSTRIPCQFTPAAPNAAHYSYAVTTWRLRCRGRFRRHAARGPRRRRLAPVHPAVCVSVFRRVLHADFRQLRRQPDLHRGRLRLHRTIARPHDRRSAAHLAAVRRSRSRADRRAACACWPIATRVVVSWVSVPEWEADRRRPGADLPGEALPRWTHRVLLLRHQCHQRRGGHRARQPAWPNHAGRFPRRSQRRLFRAVAERFGNTLQVDSSPRRSSSTRPTRTPTTTW